MPDNIDELALRLAEGGIRETFGVTGSGPSWRLISKLESRGVRYFPVSHEAAAALMAGAVARGAHRLSASISIKGPGLANMLPGIISNHYENAPALSIAEAYDHDAPTWRRHKRLDQHGLLSSIVRAQVSLDGVAQYWDALVAHANAETPGPVHIHLARGGGHPEVTDVEAGTRSNTSHEKQVMELIASARRPVVIAGSLALRRSWGRRLEQLQIPVFTTAAGKGAVSENASHAAGVFTGDGGRLTPEKNLLPQADLVVGIGVRNIELLNASVLAGVRFVSIDEVAGFTDGMHAHAEVVSTDEKIASNALQQLQECSWGLDLLESARQRMNERLLDGQWLPAACFDTMNRAPDHALVLDTGSFCTIGEHVAHSSAQRPFLGSSNGRYMGVGLPTAIGLAAANRELGVVCAVGDGGMRMYPADLKLAAEERLPLCVILMSDGQYGSIACNAPADAALSVRAVRPHQPSWWRAVEGFGVNACVVASTREFEAAFNAWDRSDPLFIEATFPAEPYLTMTEGIR